MQNTKIEGYRLSPQQRRMWELRAQSEEAPSVLYCVFTVKGALDLERLHDAAKIIVKRYEILRTTFTQMAGMGFPLQFVNESATVGWDSCDAAGLDATAAHDLLEHVLARAAARRVVYEDGPPLGIHVVTNCPDGGNAVILTAPPLYGDDCSLQNLGYEISQAYAGESAGESDDETLQFVDLCTWLNEMIEGEEAAAGREYWQKKLAHLTEKIVLPGEALQQGAYSPARTAVSLSAQQINQVTALAERIGVSRSTLLLGCWKTLLWRLSRVENVAVGVNFSGRSYDGMEKVIGRLERSAPLPTTISAGTAFWELLRSVESGYQEASDWQEHYSGELFKHLDNSFPGYGFSFDSGREPWIAGKLQWAIGKRGGPREPYKASLACVQHASGLEIALHYDQSVISKAQGERLLSQYVELLQSALDTTEKSLIDGLKLVGEEERRRLIHVFNDTAVPLDHHRNVASFIEEQARKNGQNTAVESEDSSLSYTELNQRANQVARYLRQRGIGPDNIVGICIDRCPSMIVGLLGILKAGAAYLPLDSSYPRARLDYMLADSKANVVLTEEKYHDLLRSEGRELIMLDQQWKAITRMAPDPLPIQTEPSNLAYVIYTSGSTGQPKGVMVQHGALSNHMQWMQAKYGLGEHERLLQKTTLCFDASVWEWLLPLMEGGVIVLARQGLQVDSRYLVQTIQKARITSIQVVPTMLRLLLKEKEFENCPTLQRLFVGGEALTEDLVAEYAQKVGKELINLYGPTETTVQMMIWERGWELPVGIGRGISNVTVHVVNENMELTGIGESGEICIAGIPLSRGYLNRPDATAERFTPNPFSSEPGSRLYHTRDVGTWRDDGIMEFLGRIDDQVKIRGFRVELGEIEAAVRIQPGVRDSAVLVRDDESGQKLVCYFVMEPGQHIDLKSLRQQLEERLPVYMVPGSYVRLDEMPLTPSGKLDKRSLPDPRNEASGPQHSHVAPRTVTETAIARIWSELLQLDSVGVQDNFFEVGGHSLLMIQVHNRLREELGKDVSIIDLFARPTIAALASLLSEPAASIDAPAEDSAAREEGKHSARRRRNARSESRNQQAASAAAE